MAKDKKMVVGALNITMHPHSPQKYVDLFRAASRNKTPVKIYGDQSGLLVGAGKLDESLFSKSKSKTSLNPISGDIFKFADIDLDSEWFNTETNKFASDGELKDLSLPENLKPNSSRFSYIFYPNNHILVYEGYYNGKSLAPQNAVRFFENLLNAAPLQRKFGKIDVTHEPETDALDQALNMKHKDRITMVINRPNADHLAEAERDFLKQLTELNAEKQEISYKAASQDGLKLTKSVETIARVAARNGEVSVRGKDGSNKPQEFSTKNHPLIETEYYNPDASIPFSIFSSIAERIKDEIVKRLSLSKKRST